MIDFGALTVYIYIEIICVHDCPGSIIWLIERGTAAATNIYVGGQNSWIKIDHILGKFGTYSIRSDLDVHICMCLNITYTHVTPTQEAKREGAWLRVGVTCICALIDSRFSFPFPVVLISTITDRSVILLGKY